MLSVYAAEPKWILEYTFFCNGENALRMSCSREEDVFGCVYLVSQSSFVSIMLKVSRSRNNTYDYIQTPSSHFFEEPREIKSQC